MMKKIKISDVWFTPHFDGDIMGLKGTYRGLLSADLYRAAPKSLKEYIQSAEHTEDQQKITDLIQEQLDRLNE